jgi:4-carboxymuconolactone decarboxylase
MAPNARVQVSRQEAEMKSFQALAGALFLIGTSLAAGHALARKSEQATSSAAAMSSQASGGTLPKDIYPDTGNRFPVIKRDELDEAGKKLYDVRTDGFGPGGIRLYSPSVAETMTAVNEYLRRKSGLDPRLVELAILVTAREMDCEYVWTAHEPAALKAGLGQGVIDTVKYRKPLTEIGEKEAVIIQLGRDSIIKHKVGSDTFARAVKLFGDQGLVNIVSLMGDYAATTMLLNVSDQHVRPSDKPLLPIP